MRKEHQDDFNLILDCFSGEDGGAAFTRFRWFVEDIANRADSGDEKAEQIMIVMRQFSNMIRVSLGKDSLRDG